MANKLHCPNCKSENIVFTTQTTVYGTVTSNNSAEISSGHKDFWVCSDCGTKFRHIQSYEAEIKRTDETGALKIFGIVLAVLAVVFFILSINASSFSATKGLFTMFGGVCALGSIGSFIGIPFARRSTQRKLEELERLKRDCFD